MEQVLRENLLACSEDDKMNEQLNHLLLNAPKMKYKVPSMVITPFKLSEEDAKPFLDYDKQGAEENTNTCSISSSEDEEETSSVFSFEELLLKSNHIESPNNFRRMRESLATARVSSCIKMTKDAEDIHCNSKLHLCFSSDSLPYKNNLKRKHRFSILSILEKFYSFNYFKG